MVGDQHFSFMRNKFVDQQQMFIIEEATVYELLYKVSSLDQGRNLWLKHHASEHTCNFRAVPDEFRLYITV